MDELGNDPRGSGLRGIGLQWPFNPRRTYDESPVPQPVERPDTERGAEGRPGKRAR